MTLNLFYGEPDPDRWFRHDRHVRRFLRRLVRGKQRVGGQMRVFLNLRAGLDRIGIPHRDNDFRYVWEHPDELACVVGKPFLLDRWDWHNPILFGAAVHSHPLDAPDLLQRRDIRHILVPGPWMEAMCKPYWGDKVSSWAVGIDTDAWRPTREGSKKVDVLIYDKVHWDHARHLEMLIGPIVSHLRREGRSFETIRYGHYEEEEYRAALARCRSMVFLCEHETQGIAYQQALSAAVPLLAWDPKGPWRDPEYYPSRVDFGPVTSVPYWDDRCGSTFSDFQGFLDCWGSFWDGVGRGLFDPRQYVLDNLTLEASAEAYLGFARQALGAANGPSSRPPERNT